MKKSRFTLLELMVVMLLITLITGVVLPNFINQSEALRQKNSFATVNQAFRNAHLKAMALGQPVKLTPDLTRGAFLLSPLTKQTDFRETRTTNDQSTKPILFRTSSFTLPEKVQLSEDTTTWQREEDEQDFYEFHPSGMAYGPQLILEIEEEKWEINVDRLTALPIIRPLD